MIPTHRPTASYFLRLGVRNFATPTQNSIAVISGTGKDTDFKFVPYIHRVHPNKSPSKILEKRQRGHIQGLPICFWISCIISGTGKAMNFKFCAHIHRIDRNKSLLKISGKVAVGVLKRLSKIFRAAIYRAHCAVVFAIAQLSCFKPT